MFRAFKHENWQFHAFSLHLHTQNNHASSPQPDGAASPQNITIMENLPTDPMMLFSYINTKLRDQYTSLDELCADLHIDRTTLEATLAAAGFEYNPVQNKFW